MQVDTAHNNTHQRNVRRDMLNLCRDALNGAHPSDTARLDIPREVTCEHAVCKEGDLAALELTSLYNEIRLGQIVTYVPYIPPQPPIVNTDANPRKRWTPSSLSGRVSPSKRKRCTGEKYGASKNVIICEHNNVTYHIIIYTDNNRMQCDVTTPTSIIRTTYSLRRNPHRITEEGVRHTHRVNEYQIEPTPTTPRFTVYAHDPAPMVWIFAGGY